MPLLIVATRVPRLRSSTCLLLSVVACGAACELWDPISRLEITTADATADGTVDAPLTDGSSDEVALDAAVDVVDAAPPSSSCIPPGDANPCAFVAPADNGCYCALTSQAGFDPSKASGSCLYECTGGSIVFSRTIFCAGGCIVAEAGTADTCVGTNISCPP